MRDAAANSAIPDNGRRAIDFEATAAEITAVPDDAMFERGVRAGGANRDSGPLPAGIAVSIGSERNGRPRHADGEQRSINNEASANVGELHDGAGLDGQGVGAWDCHSGKDAIGQAIII